MSMEQIKALGDAEGPILDWIGIQLQAREIDQLSKQDLIYLMLFVFNSLTFHQNIYSPMWVLRLFNKCCTIGAEGELCVARFVLGIPRSFCLNDAELAELFKMLKRLS